MNKIGLYNVASDIVELIIEVKDTVNVEAPVKITANDIVVTRKLNTANLFTFAGKFYVVFPFTLEKETLDNLNIFIGSEDKFPVMRIKNKTTI